MSEAQERRLVLTAPVVSAVAAALSLVTGWASFRAAASMWEDPIYREHTSYLAVSTAYGALLVAAAACLLAALVVAVSMLVRPLHLAGLIAAFCIIWFSGMAGMYARFEFFDSMPGNFPATVHPTWLGLASLVVLVVAMVLRTPSSAPAARRLQGQA